MIMNQIYHLLMWGSILLIVTAGWDWIQRKYRLPDSLNLRGWARLIVPLLVVLVFIGLWEALNVSWGDPVYKSFVDFAFNAAGAAGAVWGICRLTPTFAEIMNDIAGIDDEPGESD